MQKHKHWLRYRRHGRKHTMRRVQKYTRRRVHIRKIAQKRRRDKKTVGRICYKLLCAKHKKLMKMAELDAQQNRLRQEIVVIDTELPPL